MQIKRNCPDKKKVASQNYKEQTTKHTFEYIHTDVKG